MGKMFGGGGKGNSASVDYQKQADAEARDREDKRQERLRAGQKSIDEIFGGAPVMGNRKVQKTRQTPNPVHSTMAAISGQPGSMQRVGGSGDQDYMAWVPDKPEPIKGVDPYITENYEDTETYDTGVKTGGFEDPKYYYDEKRGKYVNFYDKYKNARLDFAMPEVEKQYGKAKDTLLFDLARAGTGVSTMANINNADLFEQNRVNSANQEVIANNAVNDLKTNVAANKQDVINQLYSTENAEMASNDALSKVRTLASATPDAAPLGDLFKYAVIGGGNAAASYFDPYRGVTGRNPNTSSGVVRQG